VGQARNLRLRFPGEKYLDTIEKLIGELHVPDMDALTSAKGVACRRAT
jgi:hypothetical protein